MNRTSSSRLVVPVTLGVVLVAVPTVFTVFPGWSQWSVRWRPVVMVAWLGAAGYAIRLAARSDLLLHDAVIRAEYRATIADQFGAILVAGVCGFPAQYQVTVYGPSPDGEFLIPLYPRALNQGDAAIFRAGVGATGKAWDDPEGVFVVEGEAVSSAEHGLSRAQQRRYRMFGTVAATVIFNDADEGDGVLTAIGRTADGFFDEDGVDALRNLADGIAWLLPEALLWMLPTDEEVT